MVGRGERGGKRAGRENPGLRLPWPFQTAAGITLLGNPHSILGLRHLFLTVLSF